MYAHSHAHAMTPYTRTPTPTQIVIDKKLGVVLATSSIFWCILLGLARLLFRRSDREVSTDDLTTHSA